MLFELTALISSSLVGCCCCFSSRDEKLQHFTTRVVLGTECSWKIVVWRQAEGRWGGVNRDTELELQKRERVGVLPRGGSHFSKGGGSPLKVGNGIPSKGSLMAEVNRSTVIMA